MSFFCQDPECWEKDGDQGPVTEADLAIDKHLNGVLGAARPDYGWLSEEDEDDPARLSKDRVFIIDPIDGTRSFIAGHENFAIALAVAEKGEVTSAVVHMPAKGITYAAARGMGATKNGDPIKPSNCKRANGARVLAAGPQLQTKNWRKGIPPIERHFRSSLAYRMCLVAEGRFDAMLTFRKTWEWDCSAGSLICEEAGARVTDQKGKMHRFNSEAAQMAGVVAAPPKLHQDLLSYL